MAINKDSSKDLIMLINRRMFNMVYFWFLIKIDESDINLTGIFATISIAILVLKGWNLS